LPKRPDGYSFCIITDGKDPGLTLREIASIHALGMPSYEVVLGGRWRGPTDGMKCSFADLSQLADTGRIGEMRNVLGQQATQGHIIFADDDLVFNGDFYEGLLRYGEDYDALSCRILNPDGTRYWDWKKHVNGKDYLLPYHLSSPWVSLTGTFSILKADLFDSIKWNPLLGFYAGEDVDFSERLRAGGARIRFNPYSSILHDDDRYYQFGRSVRRGFGLLRSIAKPLNSAFDAYCAISRGKVSRPP